MSQSSPSLHGQTWKTCIAAKNVGYCGPQLVCEMKEVMWQACALGGDAESAGEAANVMTLFACLRVCSLIAPHIHFLSSS